MSGDYAPAPTAIRALIRPRSIAVVGASDDPAAIGGAPLVNLRAFRTSRAVHLVSRRLTGIDGQRCAASVAELPEDIDCALLVVPGRAAAQVLGECGRRGIRAAIVFASGFGETGPDGRAAQEDLTAVAEEYGMAVAGPNCLGLVNFVDGLPLTFGAITPHPVPAGGGLGLIAQSGAMTMALTYAAHAEQVPVTYAISTGNEAVLTAEDYLDFLLEDDSTRAIALLAEQIRRPREFRRLAARARALGKPVVVLRAGREGAAAEAARSHTGALASDYAVIETVLRAEGVVLADTMDELIDAAGLLLHRGPPDRPGIGFITDSGAVKTLTLDLAASLGTELARLDEATVRDLSQTLPEFASLGNPVDITAQGLDKPGLYADAARALLRDDAVGALIVAAMPGSDLQTGEQVDALLPALAGTVKPVVYVFMGGRHVVPGGHDERVRAAGIPVLRSPERALRAVARVTASAPPPAADASAAVDGRAPEPAAATAAMTEYASKALLGACGLPVPRSQFARSADDLPAMATGLGFPLVLKAQAPSLVHKTEAGAVVTGIGDPGELATAARLMGERLSAVTDLEGYLIEQMAGPGIELIIGARRDPDWGVILLIGLGGVMAELLADVVIVPGLADDTAIRAALDRLRGRRLLDGFRGAAPSDVDAVVRVVSTLSRFMSRHPAVTEVDINPLRVFGQGRDALVLDATVISATDKG